MTSATGLMIAELIRRGCTSPGPDEPLKSIDVALSAVADGINRARASARFMVEFSLSWSDLGALAMVDRRGYLVAMSLAEVAAYLAKSLSGNPCAVNITIDDAEKLPARWTPIRLEKQAAKVAALDSADIRLEAEAKRTTALLWTAGAARRAEVIAAADRMRDCADIVDLLNAEPDPWGSLVVEAGNPLHSADYWVALPVEVAPGPVSAWWFVQVLLTGGADSDALAWFAAEAGPLVQGETDAINGAPFTGAGGVLFRADGVALARWTAAGGFTPGAGGVDQITSWITFGFGSPYVLAADRYAAGEAGALAGARARMGNRGAWGGTFALDVHGITTGERIEDLTGDIPAVLPAAL